MNVTSEQVHKAVEDYEAKIQEGAKPVQIIATLLPATDKSGVEWKTECLNIPENEILMAFTAVIRMSIDKAITPKAYGID